jgi:hypothetical protein
MISLQNRLAATTLDCESDPVLNYIYTLLTLPAMILSNIVRRVYTR